MTLVDGQIVVRVALELGPFDTPTEPDWTDLTDRVKSYRDERGRRDVLQDFGPGTARVVLNNGDRMLDPSNPDGLLFNGSDEPIGLPLCPVQIGVMWDGVEYPKFYGVLGPEAWPGDIATKGESGTVTLHVMDALGHSPGLPGDVIGIITAALLPEWWSRMDDFEFPVLDDASPVPNSIGTGSGTVEGTTGISRPYTFGPGGLGVNDPGLLLSGDHQVRFLATDLMPDGDEDKFTMFLWWTATDEIGAGDQADVAKMVHPLTGEYRWSIYVDGDDGLAYVTAFDSAGDPIDTGTITPVASSRWDNTGRHLVVAVYDAADASFTVWFGGVSTALTVASDLYESDLIIGPSPVDVVFDEVATWRRALGYTYEIAPVLLTGGYGGFWGGDLWADRLGHWFQTTGREADADDTLQWHLPDDTTTGLWGLLRPNRLGYDSPNQSFSITLPDTLADAYQITMGYGGGAVWATKENYLRARTIHALTDSAFADHYATPVTFTDEDATLGTDEYRHAGVEVTGLRIDRVINDASVTYLYSPTPPDMSTASPMTNRAIDTASRDRYGLRPHTTESEWCDWVLNQTLADLIVARFAQPRQEIERIHLDPTGTGADALALAEWLITTCELELACEVTYTPAGGDPVNIPDLNIQHIAWDWTPERWSVDIVAAAS